MIKEVEPPYLLLLEHLSICPGSANLADKPQVERIVLARNSPAQQDLGSIQPLGIPVGNATVYIQSWLDAKRQELHPQASGVHQGFQREADASMLRIGACIKKAVPPTCSAACCLARS